MPGWMKLMVLPLPVLYANLPMAGCSPDKSAGDPEVEALIEQLKEGSIEERDQAVRALIEFGDKAVPKLRAMMTGAHDVERRLLSDLLDQISIPKAARGLLPPVARVTIVAENQSAKEAFIEFQRQTGTP